MSHRLQLAYFSFFQIKALFQQIFAKQNVLNTNIMSIIIYVFSVLSWAPDKAQVLKINNV